MRPGSHRSDDADRVPLRKRLESTVMNRVSPERTRRATLTERVSVSLMSWDRLVWVNRALEILGKTASVVWFTVIAAIILGFDPKDAVSGALNSGHPMQGILAISILIPTIIFLLLRSGIGYCRWRVQRELWRRDVRRLSRLAIDAGAEASAVGQVGPDVDRKTEFRPEWAQWLQRVNPRGRRGGGGSPPPA